jgi:hypothetical protein
MFKRKSLKLFIILRQAAEYFGFAYDISNSWKKTVKSVERLFYWLKGGVRMISRQMAIQKKRYIRFCLVRNILPLSDLLYLHRRRHFDKMDVS